MPTTRELVETTESFRRYLVRGDDGQVIGADVETISTPEQINGAMIRGRLRQALAVNATHLAKTTTTNADNTVHLRRVTQQNSALIRLMLELLETVDGT